MGRASPRHATKRRPHIYEAATKRTSAGATTPPAIVLIPRPGGRAFHKFAAQKRPVASSRSRRQPATFHAAALTLTKDAEVITPHLVLLSCVHMHAHAGQSDTGAPSTDAEHIETTDVPTASVTICKACANPMGKRMHTCSKKRDRTASSTTERLSRASRARSDASKAPSSLVASGAAAVPVQACTSPCALSFHEKSSVPFLSFVSVGK